MNFCTPVPPQAGVPTVVAVPTEVPLRYIVMVPPFRTIAMWCQVLNAMDVVAVIVDHFALAGVLRYVASSVVDVAVTSRRSGKPISPEVPVNELK